MLHDGVLWYNQLSMCLPIAIDEKCSSFHFLLHFLFLPHYYNCNCYCYTITAIEFVSIYPVIPLLLLVLLVVLRIDLIHQFLNNWNNTNCQNGHLPCTNPLKMNWNSFVYRCWWKLHFVNWPMIAHPWQDTPSWQHFINVFHSPSIFNSSANVATCS